MLHFVSFFFKSHLARKQTFDKCKFHFAAVKDAFLLGFIDNKIDNNFMHHMHLLTQNWLEILYFDFIQTNPLYLVHITSIFAEKIQNSLHFAGFYHENYKCFWTLTAEEFIKSLCISKAKMAIQNSAEICLLVNSLARTFLSICSYVCLDLSEKKQPRHDKSVEFC